MAVVSVFRASVGTSVDGGWATERGTVVVGAAVVGMGDEADAAAAAETKAELATDIDTRLLERVLLRREYEWRMGGRGLNTRR